MIKFKFFLNLKTKRNNLISNKKPKFQKHKDDDEDHKNLEDVKDQEIKEIEDF